MLQDVPRGSSPAQEFYANVSMSSSADSSDKLSLPEPGSTFGMHLTTMTILRGLSFEHVEEIFSSKFGFCCLEMPNRLHPFPA